MITQDRTIARLTLWTSTAIAAWIVVVMLRPFAEPLATGALLAVAFHAPHMWIKRWLPNHPSIAATVSTVLILLLFIGPLSVVVPILVREVRESIAALQASGSLVEQVATWLGIPVDELRHEVASRLQAAGETLLRQGVSAIGAATGGIIRLTVAIVAFFFIVRDGTSIRRDTIAISPLGRERTENLFQVATEMVQASMYGVVGVAVAQGTLCGIGVWMAGLPLPVMWGFAAAAASVVPFIGSALVWVPAVVMLFMQGKVGWAIFMLAWGAGVVGMADNIVRPWILSSRTPVNPLLVMVSMLGSAQVFGLIGFVAGPVILAIFIALLRTLREEMAAPPDEDTPACPQGMPPHR